MSKSIFKPLWSLDIIKTEKWLCEMSAKGYHLIEIKSVTKVFVFEKGESKSISYRICHHKAGINAASPSLISSGWHNIFSKRKWSILANENDKTQIKVNPSRESLLNRNRFIKNSIGLLLTIYLMMSIPSMFLLLFVLFSSDVTFESGGNLSFLSSLLIQLLVISFLVYIIIKLNKSDKKLRLESGTDLNLSFTIPKDTILNHATEKTFRKNGKVIKRIKIGWFYAPDRAEEWLEDMEMKGYNLYRMSRLGNTFYFTKGEPRKVKYCLDFQSAVNDSYFEIHKSNGWKLIFTSLSNSSKYTLWGKEYSDEKPELYSDKIHILKHARKQCRLYCILYIPMIIMYLCLFGLNIIMYSKGFQMSLLLIVVFSVCIVEFGYFVLTSLGYYLRIRKKLS